MTVLASPVRDSLLAAGLANQQRGRLAEAEQCYRVLLAQSPRDFDGLYRMGVLALQCSNAVAAVHYLRGAGEVRALDADGLYNLGMAHALDHAFDEARAAFAQAVALDPAHAPAAVGLGNVLKFLGEASGSAEAYLAAVRSPRIGATLFSQLLVGLHVNATVDAATLFDLHREWARRFAAPHYPAASACADAPDPHRRLRLGLVSPSFNARIVGHFLRGVLPALAAQVDIVLYDSGTERDWLSAELRATASAAHDVAALTDEQVATLVRNDRIDVLVDLAGHAPGHRLGVFARRPAPVQVTWLDYFDTTGVETIDVVVSDPVSTPESALASGAQRFVERVVRMPHARLCYAVPPYAPEVAPSPCVARDHVTFGCFGRADKVDAQVVALWSRVLREVPDARFVLKSGGFDVDAVRTRVLRDFVREGILAERVAFRGASSHEALLAEYADLDVALDTFPYNGGATTCDALSMGVPVVTLAGTSMISRQGAALLHAAGRSEWVAGDASAYVRIAADLARDPQRLAAVRAGLRRELVASPLCDGERFARDFAALVRQVWAEWCARAADAQSGRAGAPACTA